MAEDSRTFLDSIREHPVITGVMVVCTLGGMVLGGIYLSPEWLILRRLAAGAFGGALVGIFITAPRMIG